MRRWGRTAIAALFVTAALLGVPLTDERVASAAFTVSNLDDSGAGSLRSALLNLSSFGDPSENLITFESGLVGAIYVASNLPTITLPVEIRGPGSDSLLIDGQGNRLFVMSGVDRFELSGVQVRNGESSGGGAIRASASSIVVDDVVFESNSTSGRGGAIGAISGSTIRVANSVFRRNSSAGDGGAISTTTAVATTIDGSVFERNSTATDGAGGAVYIDGGRADVTDSGFDSNIAADSAGGAIRAATSGSFADPGFVVADSSFTSNSSESGGALAVASGSSRVESSRFVDNAATYGGAITGSLSIRSSEFLSNTATGWGGAVSSFTAVSGDDGVTRSVILESSTFDGNTAPIGAAVRAPVIDADQSSFIENTGGPAVVSTSGDAASSITNTLFEANQGGLSLRSGAINASSFLNNAGTTVGALSVLRGSVTVDGSTFSDNTSESAGGIRVRPSGENAALRIRHSTIAGTEVRRVGEASLSIDHSVITESLLIEAGPFVEVTHSSLAGGDVGPVLISDSLVGLDPALGPVGNHGGQTPTILPLAGSPLVDAGTKDLGSQRRVEQRDLSPISGGAVDIGAVEVQGGQVAWAVADSPFEGEFGLVRINRTAGLDPVGVRVADLAGTAVPEVDYEPVSELVVWESGEEGTKTVRISALDDDVLDDGETFELAIETSGGAEIVGADSVTVTITDGYRPFIESLPPARVVDTRPTGVTVDGKNSGNGRRPAESEIEVQLAGRAGVPDDARAVVLNLTAVRPDSTGFITLSPCEERPVASSLNFARGSNVGNEVIAGLSPDGATCVYTSTGTDLTLDIVGYVPAVSPVRLVTPARILDSRSNETTIDGIAEAIGRFESDQVDELPVAGRAGLPDDAAAAVLNITAVGPAGVGFVTTWACGDSRPNASSLNYVGGANRGNEIVAQLSPTGSLCVYTSNATHLTVDVVGWLSAAVDYVPTVPERFVDSRLTGATTDNRFVAFDRLDADDDITVRIAGRGAVPPEAAGVVVNTTAIDAAAVGFLTVWDCLGPPPNASSLNYEPGINGGNEIVAALGEDGDLCVYSSASTHIALDVVGYLS